MSKIKPVKLSSARAWRTYLGGKLIDKLHGNEGASDTNFPEEWLMSTVRARNVGREHIVEGISLTQDGITLKEFIDSDPVGVLGKEHYQKYGNQTGVLVKLLDSMERLTVQVHPTKDTAKKLFDSQFGKTECWHILECREDIGEKPCIYLGFKEGITREKWQVCFDNQDISGMLDCLHRVEVKPGETYLICGGVPHAIGAGCMLVEIQEPTDYTVRTERVTPSGLKIDDFMCHQGLGFEKMFDCFNYEGLSYQEVLKRWQIIPIEKLTDEYVETEVVGYRDTQMFALKVIDIKDKYSIKSNGIFSGIYVLSGKGIMDGVAINQGDQFFLPANVSDFDIVNTGDMPIKVIRFFGPQI